jgi:hypothetical protein
MGTQPGASWGCTGGCCIYMNMCSGVCAHTRCIKRYQMHAIFRRRVYVLVIMHTHMTRKPCIYTRRNHVYLKKTSDIYMYASS